VIGRAIASSAAAWLNVGLLAATLWREAVWRPSPALVARLARVGLAVAAMGAVLFAASVNYAALSALLTKEAAVVATVAAGGLVYALAVVLFRAATLSELKSALRREPGGSPTSGLD
jgi:putative peptidoglycan lipid II flippase